MMIRSLLATLSVLSLVHAVSANPFSVKSPDGTIEVKVKLTDKVYYSVHVDGEEAMWFSPLSMRTSEGHWGMNPELDDDEIVSVDETIETVWGIRSEVRNHYNQLNLEFEGDYSIHFRAYNDGVAYRFSTDADGELIVYDEEVQYRFWEDHDMVNHVVDSFTTSYERFYTRQTINEMPQDTLVSLPSLIDQGDLYLMVMESDLYEYPGLYLTRKGLHTRYYIDGALPQYPKSWEVGGWQNFSLIVTEREDYLAKTTGNRSFPWRVLGIARSDLELADSDLVYKLARPAKIETDWIKPGKVAWDWWNALNLTGVDFETGINDETYEYFIDFAARNGIEYVIMDEGWSDQFDVLLPTPQVDMEHLTQYARERGVGLILWAVWYPLDRQYEEAFDLFEEWGIAGVKVDFIDRDDQIAIEFYERLAAAAAEHKLLVDYHGVSKPTGLHRTYPNVINFEAMRGNEYNKFSAEGVPPHHNVDLAFTRMFAGPLDYTPGSMTNSVEGDFSARFDNPTSMGTRAHQLGMFVVYYSPLEMLCDAPTAYEKYPDILRFLSQMPVTWDDTVALDGKLGEYIIIARRKGDDWYVGGLTDWTERDIELDLSFLGSGNYNAEILKDGINANRQAEDYVHEEKRVNAGMTLPITMKKGGGFAIHFSQ